VHGLLCVRLALMRVGSQHVLMYTYYLLAILLGKDPKARGGDAMLRMEALTYACAARSGRATCGGAAT